MSRWISSRSQAIEESAVLRYNHEHGEHGQFSSGGGGGESKIILNTSDGAEAYAGISPVPPPGGTADDGTKRESAAAENKVVEAYPSWDVVYDPGDDAGNPSGYFAIHREQGLGTMESSEGDPTVPTLGQLTGQMDALIKDDPLLSK